MSNHGPLITAKDLAMHLGMSVGTIYRLAQDGRIPSYHAGQKLHGIRFDVEEVRAALRRRIADGANHD
jgi:excisionase family DNA binding protein